MIAGPGVGEEDFEQVCEHQPGNDARPPLASRMKLGRDLCAAAHDCRHETLADSAAGHCPLNHEVIEYISERVGAPVRVLPVEHEDSMLVHPDVPWGEVPLRDDEWPGPIGQRGATRAEGPLERRYIIVRQM